MSAKLRVLKIEAVGDFAAGKIKPKIRLTGNWLDRAGFKAGRHIEVRLLKTGKLALCLKELGN